MVILTLGFQYPQEEGEKEFITAFHCVDSAGHTRADGTMFVIAAACL